MMDGKGGGTLGVGREDHTLFLATCMNTRTLYKCFISVLAFCTFIFLPVLE